MNTAFIRVHFFLLNVSYFAKEEVSHHQKQMFYSAQSVYDHETSYILSRTVTEGYSTYNTLCT